MATFIGDYTCKVDVKGRIILPMAFKKQMPADAQDHFVVRKDIFENCLVLYSIEDWNRQLDKIRKRINPYNREHNMFLRNFFKGTAELSLDNNNRLLVPKRLMDLIGAERDVVLAGQDGTHRDMGSKVSMTRLIWQQMTLLTWLRNLWVEV